MSNVRVQLTGLKKFNQYITATCIVELHLDRWCWLLKMGTKLHVRWFMIVHSRIHPTILRPKCFPSLSPHLLFIAGSSLFSSISSDLDPRIKHFPKFSFIFFLGFDSSFNLLGFSPLLLIWVSSRKWGKTKLTRLCREPGSAPAPLALKRSKTAWFVSFHTINPFQFLLPSIPRFKFRLILLFFFFFESILIGFAFIQFVGLMGMLCFWCVCVKLFVIGELIHVFFWWVSLFCECSANHLS